MKGDRSLNVVEENVIGVKHGNTFSLDAEKGYVIVDVDNFGEMTTIEAICREDVRRELAAGAKKLGLTKMWGMKQQA